MHPVYTSLFFLLLNLAPLLSAGQFTGNDPDPTRWLNYSQTYYKLPIAEKGIYRITVAELRKAGVPTDKVDPTTVQLFHRGIEQAIYVEGEADAHFDAGDFLEFYGQGNDGIPDSSLYRPANAQPHAYYSLFSDTTAYFLTWQLDGKVGKRMTSCSDTTSDGLLPEPFHWAEDRRLFTDNYPGWATGIPPKIEFSYYEAGEGYTGQIQHKDKPYTNAFPLSQAVKNGPLPQLTILLAGRDYMNHRVDCLVGPTPDTQRLLDSVRFLTYDNARIRQDLRWSDVGPNGSLFISTVSRGENTSVDPYSVSLIRLRYPQALTATGQSPQVFTLEPNAVGRSLINISNVQNGARFWDITDPTAPVQLRVPSPAPGSARLIIQGTQVSKTILSINQPKTVPTIRPVTFVNWTTRKPTYLIISHEALMKPVGDSITGGPLNAVGAYAAYRASTAGGGYDTLTATMQQLIDQYNYGERSPLAIRRFAAQMLKQSKESLQYMLLIGRARSTPGIRRDPNQSLLDMVMTAGFPGSDIVLTSGLNGGPDASPAIPTGRINADTPQQVINYLNKVKEYESQSDDLLWRKHLLHLSGGTTPGEQDLFRRLVDSYRDQATTQSLGARVTTLSKETTSLIEPTRVVTPVNEGIGLITFFGHSGLDLTDLDIGFSSNNALGYQNKGYYPILLINGCAIGNFFFGRPTLATDWVLTPDRGAIAAIAQSHLGYPDVMHRYSTIFYNLLADSAQLYKSIGQLQQETVRRVLAQSTDERELANCQQMVLQGDPAIRLFPFKTPDYALAPGGLTIQGADNQPLTNLSDSLHIKLTVQNTGQYQAGAVPVRVRRWVNGQESVVFNVVIPRAVAYSDTLTFTLPNERNAEGANLFEVTLNPVDAPLARRETNRSNNLATLELIIPDQRPILLYPAPHSLIKTEAVGLTAHYLTDGAHRFDLELDSTARFDSPVRQSHQLTAATIIHYPVTLAAQRNTTYHWRVRLANPEGDSAKVNQHPWVTSSFMYAPDSTATGLPEGQLWVEKPLPSGLQQGDVVFLQAQFTNLSAYPFTDSLVVQQTIYAAGLANPQLKSWQLKAPIRSDTIRFTTQLDTKQLAGINRVVLTVNPRLQPEYSFLNNTLDLPLPVQPDRLGPLLEVAVDGAQITDGSVVSARPIIDVLVADDNRSLIRRDTAGVDLYLKCPGSNTSFRRLNWRGSVVQPTNSDNVFRVRYASPNLAEGLYHLLVKAHDLVGNPALPYQISFRVMNDRKLTDFSTYPNPFRSQTLFSFHLTGNTPPSDINLTLMNLAGQAVRHMSVPPRIGLNEWIWDGCDDTGKPVQAGTYLYKLAIADMRGLEWTIANDVDKKLSGRIIVTR